MSVHHQRNPFLLFDFLGQEFLSLIGPFLDDEPDENDLNRDQISDPAKKPVL